MVLALATLIGIRRGIGKMKFSVITPFSRFQNKYTLINHLVPLKVTWHPILDIKDDYRFNWNEPWIKPFACEVKVTKNRGYFKCNAFIKHGLDNNTYYSFLNDDDFYEPNFFTKIMLNTPTEPVIVVSMKRGDNIVTYPDSPESEHPCYTLPAAPQNMIEYRVGQEQLIIKGSLLKTLRFDEYSNVADGKLARELKESGVDIKYLMDIFIWFNYLEPGRWRKE